MDDCAIKMIRKYHATLLRYAKILRDHKEMVREDDYMDIQWKCRVARHFVKVENQTKEIIEKIKELRKEYKCWDY